MGWKDFVEPVIPEGNAVFTVYTVKHEATDGGTEYFQIAASVDEHTGTWNPDDPKLMDPIGQTAFGRLWIPKEDDPSKKKYGKLTRITNFLKVMKAAGAVIPDELDPVEAADAALDEFAGKSFAGAVAHSDMMDMDTNTITGVRAEISPFRFRRLR